MNVFAGLALLAFAYLGGISSVSGAMVGSLLVAGGLVDAITSLHLDSLDPEYFTLIGGVGLILTAILNPEGIATGNIQLWSHVIRPRLQGLVSPRRPKSGDGVGCDDRGLRGCRRRGIDAGGRLIMAEPMLETKGLTVTFGGLNANDNVDIVVPTGSFVGLIGPNGAGKTTFIDAITGFVSTSAGTATFDGAPLLQVAPHDRAKRGLVRTFQSLELFEDLSVEDNLYAAADNPRWWGFLADMFWPTRSGKNQAVERAIEAMELDDYREPCPAIYRMGNGSWSVWPEPWRPTRN